MLSAEDRSILEFESRWWLEAGPKDQAIEHRLGVTAAAYYERLIAIVFTSEARNHDPLTVSRVRAMIEPSDEAAS